MQRQGRGLKREPARGSTLPDAPFLGYRHDCPRPRGGGGGRRPGGVGDAGILKAETGGGAFAPSPSAPPPRGDTSHGPVYGEGLKGEPARGFTLPDAPFLGYRHDYPRPSGRGWGRGEPGGVGGDAGICVRDHKDPCCGPRRHPFPDGSQLSRRFTPGSGASIDVTSSGPLRFRPALDGGTAPGSHPERS
jgi:hypothetical protein